MSVAVAVEVVGLGLDVVPAVGAVEDVVVADAVLDSTPPVAGQTDDVVEPVVDFLQAEDRDAEVVDRACQSWGAFRPGPGAAALVAVVGAEDVEGGEPGDGGQAFPEARFSAQMFALSLVR